MNSIEPLIAKIHALDVLPTQKECLEVRAYFESHKKGGWCDFGRDNGIYLMVHRELVDGLFDYIQSLRAEGPFVEICAGRGKLSYWLSQRGLPIVAVDNYSWDNVPRESHVVEASHQEALNRYNPELVVACFPYDIPIPIDVVTHPSVRHFIHLGNAGMNERWKSYIEEEAHIVTKDLDGVVDTYPTFDDWGSAVRASNKHYYISR
ncbi:hypothetical protein HZB01_05585 [Candidatus Woesearchaeota archaeon]|nr:hypothetical protein [Candidatus Woesearchaeota archaeon]